MMQMTTAVDETAWRGECEHVAPRLTRGFTDHSHYHYHYGSEWRRRLDSMKQYLDQVSAYRRSAVVGPSTTTTRTTTTATITTIQEEPGLVRKLSALAEVVQEEAEKISSGERVVSRLSSFSSLQREWAQLVKVS